MGSCLEGPFIKYVQGGKTGFLSALYADTGRLGKLQFYERTVFPSIDYTEGTLIIKLHFNQKLHFRNHLRYHTSQKQPVDTLRIMY